MNKAIGVIAAVGSTTAFAMASLGGAAAANGVCSSESYAQSGIFAWMTSGSVHDTGLVVTAPATGETLTVTSSSWTTYENIDPESTPSRADQNEDNEQVGLAVGGTSIGGLSTDLPDTVDEGAPDDWSSGIVSGSFGGAGSAIAGGSITLHHASLNGVGEGPNTFIVKSFSLELQRCAAPAPTTATPTTTAAPTTTVSTVSAAPTTTMATVPPASVLPATISAPAAAPAAAAPAAAPTTLAPTTTAVRSAPASLPATGGEMTIPLVLASLAGLTGTALLVVRRRPS